MSTKAHLSAVVGAVALILSTGVGAVAAGGTTTIASPASDPFYTPPAHLASYAPGAVLRSRPVTLATFAALPLKVTAWQLLYRTTDHAGAPEATVTTVLRPAGAAPKGVISYQIAEDAGAPQCAPSYTLRAGTDFEPVNQAEGLLIDAAVAQGFAVSVPDYEGPDGDFGAARQPGYAVLDGVRAAQHFESLGLSGPHTPVGIWGYSGGSLASGWAAQVQPTYAPELNVRGVALGGFVTNIPQTLLKINGGVGAGLIVSVLQHLAATVPAVAKLINSYVTPAGKAMLATGARQCETANVTEYAFTNLNKYLTLPLSQLLAMPAVKAAVDGLNLGGTTPTAPLFVYHAVNDELVPIASTDATVASYCSRGGDVTYTRDSLSEHIVLAFTGAPSALSWLSTRLTGGAAPSGCSTKTVLTMLLSPTGLSGGAKLLLADALALLGQPIGQF
ncbi:lipase family protein [Jatrophihabitans sp.]|uniref:lipase family protein n=1 Tax=Jatrophihabitans sp. TaxID=1932789 RepID=UPI0030C77398|nr:hypothetical protein [Jatrophihabitans sp.]